MTISITPKTLATGSNRASKQVSVNVWNEGHDISGAASRLVGFDAAGVGAEIDIGPSSRSALAEADTNFPAYLRESGREGQFNFDSSDLSAEVADDTQQAIYVAPASDPTGASGAWVRRYSGSVDVCWFGAKGDGVTDDRDAIQAALDYVDNLGGGQVRLPVVPPQAVTNYLISGYLSVYPKTRIKGDGRSVTKITTTALGGGGADAHEDVRNGSVLVSDQPINASTRVDIYVEDLGLAASNGANVGACFYDRGGTFWSLHRVRCDGGKYGVVMEQSELCDVFEGDFENQSTAGVWIVDGPDLSPGALGGWANRIGIYNSQFNPGAAAYGILSGGGANHVFADNNYNGGVNSIFIQGTAPMVIRGGQFESATGANIKVTESVYLSIEGGTYTQTNGNAAIDFTGGTGTLMLSGVPVFSGGTGANPIAGANNLFRLWLGAVINNTAVALYSGTPTHLNDTMDDSVPPVEIAWGSQLLFKDVIDDTYASYEEHVSEAGVRWHQVVAKGGGGGWAGGYRLKLNFNAGALFDAFTASSNGDGVSASGTFVGTFNVSNPTAANAAYKINGTKVIGPQGAAVADAVAAAAAPTQAEFNALVTQFNAALARLRAHGLIAT